MASSTCSGVFGPQGSPQWLVVLGSCSMGVLHLPRAGAASCAAENPRAARIGRTTPRWRQILHGWAKLVLASLAFRPFPGDWKCWTDVPQEDRNQRGQVWLAGPLRSQGAVPKGSWNWQNPTYEWRQILHGWAKLVLAFLGCGPFPGGWWYWVLLCRVVAPLEGRQASSVKAPAVVSFLQMLRPALWDGRQSQVQCVHAV